MYGGERRKYQLEKQGICTEKIEQKAVQILEELRTEGYTLLEGKILVEELGCALHEAEKHSHKMKLSEIRYQVPDRDRHFPL